MTTSLCFCGSVWRTRTRTLANEGSSLSYASDLDPQSTSTPNGHYGARPPSQGRRLSLRVFGAHEQPSLTHLKPSPARQKCLLLLGKLNREGWVPLPPQLRSASIRSAPLDPHIHTQPVASACIYRGDGFYQQPDRQVSVDIRRSVSFSLLTIISGSFMLLPCTPSPRSQDTYPRRQTGSCRGTASFACVPPS